MPSSPQSASPDSGGKWGFRSRLAFAVLGGIALVFLLLEHRIHFLGALPYLLLLACPLMHLFHHGGHGHGAGHGHHEHRLPERQP
jgi:hypothetical protein